MKSLRVIQGFAKALSIIFKILFIVAIVLTSLAFLGSITLPIIANMPLSDGKDLPTILAEQGVSYMNILAYCIAGVLYFGYIIFISYFAHRYFKKVVMAGSPFSYVLAGNMRKLAYTVLLASLAAMTTISIVVAIMRASSDGVGSVDYSYSFGIVFSVVLIILSFFCEYGAELEKAKSNENGVESVDSSSNEEK